jgi:hypothetical protein
MGGFYFFLCPCARLNENRLLCQYQGFKYCPGPRGQGKGNGAVGVANSGKDMIDKKLLAILILLAGYVLWVKPLQQEVAPQWVQLTTIRKSIAKEEFIARQAEKIKSVYCILHF